MASHTGSICLEVIVQFWLSNLTLPDGTVIGSSDFGIN